MNVEDRIARLERHNRLLLAGVLALALALTIAATSGKEIPDVVRARAFHVVGKKGVELVKIGDISQLGEGWPGLNVGTVTTFTETGALSAMVRGSFKGAGVVSTYNERLEVLVELGQDDLGGGSILTNDKDGKRMVHLTATTNGHGVVETTNKDGAPLVRITSRADGPGMISTYDPRSIEARGVYSTRP